MKHLVDSTSSLSAQKSSTHARPAGLRVKSRWNGMAPTSCAKTPGFVIMNTLFSIALVNYRAEFAQPDLLIIQEPLIWRNHILYV